MTAMDFLRLVQFWPFVMATLAEDDYTPKAKEYHKGLSDSVFSDEELLLCSARLADYVEIQRRTEIKMKDMRFIEQKIRDHHTLFAEVGFLLV